MKLRALLDMKTVFHMLKMASDVKQARIRDICLEYAFKNYSEFIGNKAGTKVLGLDLFQEVISMYNSNQHVKAPPTDEPPSTLKDDFKAIFSDMKEFDLVIQVGADPIRCHKAIVGGFSPVLAKSVAAAKENSKKQPTIELPELKVPDAGKAFLQFVYYGDTAIHPLAACDLVSFNLFHKLNTVQTVVEHIIKTSVEKETVLRKSFSF
eukprot:TRINITY_DN1322_c2_g1_i2.p1 TRINITY_DN1322_c2_g1~~TRINITY_DN1322_c2_g1_i2.p1  ORF type:complete len:219 (+),score=25.32 TRINITY_DN1322_c2_g1_i2:34-657(+)